MDLWPAVAHVQVVGGSGVQPPHRHPMSCYSSRIHIAFERISEANASSSPLRPETTYSVDGIRWPGLPRREYHARRTIVNSHDRALFVRTDEKKRNARTTAACFGDKTDRRWCLFRFRERGAVDHAREEAPLAFAT